MNRRIIAVIVAVALALGGGTLVLLYAKNADTRAVAAAQPTSVWVAQKEIPAGTTLKDAERTELIARTTVAASAKPTGALDDINADNNALLALSDVQPGEYLLAARFGSKPVGTKAIEVPSGMLAISVELSDPARVGKFVTPGSRIAVYASYGLVKTEDTDAAKHFNDLDLKGTHVLLEDVQVIGMGEQPLSAPKAVVRTTDEKESAARGGSDAPSFLVTVAVTPEQSVRLVHAINTYTLYAGLRGSDVKLSPNAETSDLTIFRAVKP